MKFTKMHGAGNDYIYIDMFTEKLSDPEKAAITLSDRHFGIGGDGIILIYPSEIADFRMAMYNNDGSEGKMCGNAARCIGKYVYDHGLTANTEVTLETLSGIKNLQLEVTDGKVSSVSVNMGKANLECIKIPMRWDSEHFINQPVMMPGGETLLGTAVSMGNPHIVFFVDDVDFDDFELYGTFTERNEIFPERVNTEFVKRISETEITMRVWERGSGETLACGTGACASVVACVLNGFCEYDTEIRVNLKGGIIYVTYNADGTVIMRGGAETVFIGEIDL